MQQRGAPRSWGLALSAVVAALAVGAPAPPTLASELVAGAQTTRAAPMPEERAVVVKRAEQGKGKPLAGRKWTIYRNGVVDPRGDFHSFDRMRRRLLTAAFGVGDGRAWVRFRRRVKAEAPTLASMPVPELWGFLEMLVRRGVLAPFAP